MSIKNKISAIGSITLTIIVFVGVAIIPFAVIFGLSTIATIILPWLSYAMWIVFVFNILILLPLLLIKKTRPYSGLGLFISSYVY